MKCIQKGEERGKKRMRGREKKGNRNFDIKKKIKG